MQHFFIVVPGEEKEEEYIKTHPENILEWENRRCTPYSYGKSVSAHHISHSWPENTHALLKKKNIFSILKDIMNHELHTLILDQQKWVRHRWATLLKCEGLWDFQHVLHCSMNKWCGYRIFVHCYWGLCVKCWGTSLWNWK